MSFSQTGILSPTSPPKSSVSILSDLVVWRLLLSLGAPFKRLVALLLLFGRNFVSVLQELQRWVLASVGWMSAPPSSALLRHLGTSFLHTRRWHFGAGEILRSRPATKTCGKLLIRQFFCSYMGVSFISSEPFLLALKIQADLLWRHPDFTSSCRNLLTQLPW